jgi:hypothetical protein
MGGICLHCGGPQPGVDAICPYCGQAVIASPGQAGTTALQSTDTLVLPAPPVTATAVGTATMTATQVLAPLPPPPPLPMPTDRQLAASGLRKPSRRAKIALGTAVVLVIGGVVAYEVLKPQPPSAADTVRAYFADLAKGDTASALKLVDPGAASGQLGTLDALRSAAVLSSPASRPSGLTIVSSTQESDLYGRSLSSVSVSYKLGSSAVSQDFTVAADATDGTGAKQPFLLENPFLTLEIQDSGGRPLTVNGVSAGAQDVEAAVFPGAYTVAMQGDQLIAGESQTAAYAPSGGGGTLSVDFSSPRLAPGAEAAVQAQIKSALDACAQSTSTAPQNCPFSIYNFGYGYGTPDSVQWTIQTYPAATVSVYDGAGQGEEVKFVDAQQDGVVQWTDHYTDYTGAAQTSSGTQNFGASGYASVSGGAVQITFNAYVF